MITPKEIQQKAERKYGAFLRAIANRETILPLEFPVGKIPSDFIALRDAITQLQTRAQPQRGFGYQIELMGRNTRKHGLQSVPERIFIDSETDYLKLIGKTKEVKQFRENLTLIYQTIPELYPWLCEHPKKVIQYQSDWSNLLKVCGYFQHHPQPNCYIRELPIAIHTKFIEQHQKILQELLEFLLPAEQLGAIADDAEHKFEKRFGLKYKEPLIRMRFLDSELQHHSHFLTDDFSLPLSAFAQLKLQPRRCLITENLINFLTLPNIIGTLAIFGSGYRVGSLKGVSWLRNCPIEYWGDLDVDGFKILAQLRSHFPQTRSLLMDQDTWTRFAEFAVADPKAKVEEIVHLTPTEQQLYGELAQNQQRLEQEHISQNYANHIIQKLASS